MGTFAESGARATAASAPAALSASPATAALVEALPEVYQPIYGHPQWASAASRPCADRLVTLAAVHDALADVLGRQVRVLDLGCAQGFFSLSLAERGAQVVGVDFTAANVNVCSALQAESHHLDAAFVSGRIEDFLPLLGENDFDLVLGLSVFHHLVHEHGAQYVTQLLGQLAQHVGVGVFEMALAEEPLYWGSSQPADPRTLLTSYRFVEPLAEHRTHLSAIVRPLFLASSRYRSVDGRLVAV